MEMWELLKSLFSEVNFSFWNASVAQTPQDSLVDTDHVQSRSLELWWAEGGGSAPSTSVKVEERIPSRAGWAAQASLLPSYTSEKPHSWQVNSVWSMCHDLLCLFCFKRLRNTAACCYETYRMRREGEGELRALHMLLVIAVTSQQTHKHRPCKRGWERILPLSRRDSPGMSSLLYFSGWGYFVRKWGQTPRSFVGT